MTANEFRCPVCGCNRLWDTGLEDGQLRCASLKCYWVGTWADVLAARPESITVQKTIEPSDEMLELLPGFNWAIIYKRNGDAKIWRFYPTEEEARNSPALNGDYGTRLVKIVEVDATSDVLAARQGAEPAEGYQHVPLEKVGENVVMSRDAYEEMQRQLAEAREREAEYKRLYENSAAAFEKELKRHGDTRQQLGEAREQLAEHKGFCRIAAEKATKLDFELAAATARADKLGVENGILLDSITSICSVRVKLYVSDRTLDATIQAAAKAVDNSPATATAVERARRLEAQGRLLRGLLSEVYSQAGNEAEAHRRHALTPGLRDSIRDTLMELGEWPRKAAFDAEGGAE